MEILKVLAKDSVAWILNYEEIPVIIDWDMTMEVGGWCKNHRRLQDMEWATRVTEESSMWIMKSPRRMTGVILQSKTLNQKQRTSRDEGVFHACKQWPGGGIPPHCKGNSTVYKSNMVSRNFKWLSPFEL